MVARWSTTAESTTAGRYFSIPKRPIVALNATFTYFGNFGRLNVAGEKTNIYGLIRNLILLLFSLIIFFENDGKSVKNSICFSKFSIIFEDFENP